MLHLLSMAVNPKLNLRQSLVNWREISLGLREAPRKRSLQTETLQYMVKCY